MGYYRRSSLLRMLLVTLARWIPWLVKSWRGKDNGSGKIVFCHFREEIDWVVQRLKTGGVQNIVVFDARTSLVKRMKVLKNDPIDVLVVQIQTGSEGLNLQSKFSEIYFVSPHWNPAVEQQAIARCHRIGQEKTVHVFKYEMESFEVPVEMGEEPRTMKTLDQYIYNMHTGKRGNRATNYTTINGRKNN